MNQIFAIVHGDTKKLITTKHSVEDVTQYVKEELSHKDNVLVVQRKTDLTSFNNKQLLKFYNDVANKSVKKFSSHNDGLNRVWKFLAPKEVHKPSREEDSMSFAKRANVEKEKAPVKKSPLTKKKAAPKKKVTPKKAAPKKAAPKKKASTTKKATTSKKNGTIGSLVSDALMAGHSTPEILDMVTESFPDANTTVSSVNWYRSKLRRDGKVVPNPKA